MRCPQAEDANNLTCTEKDRCHQDKSRLNCVTKEVLKSWNKAGYSNCIAGPRSIANQILSLIETARFKKESFWNETFILNDNKQRAKIEKHIKSEDLPEDVEENELAFIQDQVGERIRRIAPTDRNVILSVKKLKKKELLKRKREEAEVNKKLKEKKRKTEEITLVGGKAEEAILQSFLEQNNIPNDESLNCDDYCSDEEDFYQTTSQNDTFKIHNEQSVANLIKQTTPHAIASEISENSHYLLICATLSAMGVDIQNLAISNKRFKNIRNEAIFNMSNRITKESREIMLNEKLQLHIDGKRISQQNKDQSKSAPERITISVSPFSNPDKKKDILLKIIQVERGTGLLMAQEVYDVLREYNCHNNIVVVTTDTTASMTGGYTGFIVELQKLLGKKVLWAPCRRHSAERHIRKSFLEVTGLETVGPTHQIYKDLRCQWPENEPNEKQDQWSYLKKPRNVFLQRKIKDSCEFLQQVIDTNVFPRSDYRQMAELALLLMTEKVPENFKIPPPGAAHEARFMSTSLYCMKVVLVKEIFQVCDDLMLSKIIDFVMVMCIFFVPYFLQTSLFLKAPQLDLKFSQDLNELVQSTKNSNYKKVCKSMIASLQTTHPYYLCQELVMLSLMDEDVSIAEKEDIADRIRHTQAEKVDENLFKPIFPNFEGKMKLSDFAEERSIYFFKLFDIPTDFLSKHPNDWETDKDFIKMKSYCLHLNSVNDPAERFIKLCQSCISLARSEEKLQDVFQMAHHVKQNCGKTTVVKAKRCLAFGLQEVSKSVI